MNVNYAVSTIGQAPRHEFVGLNSTLLSVRIEHVLAHSNA
jgi:hypothetical protein